MNDIVGRLRSADISGHGSYSELVRNAADEIVRLRAILSAADHTLTVHGKIDFNTPLHERITAALSSGD